MALNFSGLFTRREQNIDSAAGAGKNAPVSDTGKVYSADQIRNVKPGQTLKGEVIAKDGNAVQIRLDRDTVIHARLDRDMNIGVGQNLTFEVQKQSQNGGKSGIALRPLYENLTQDANVLKALSAASIPLSEDTAAMVSQLMRAGLSIDIDSLQGMYKDMMAFPEAALEDLAALRKLGLPINEENLQQIAAYRNLEHQILGGVEKLSEEASAMLLDLVDTDPTGAGRILHEMLRIFGAESTMEGVPGKTAEIVETTENSAAGAVRENIAEAVSKDGAVILKNAMTESVLDLQAAEDGIKTGAEDGAKAGAGQEQPAVVSGNGNAEAADVRGGNFKDTLLQRLPEGEARLAFSEKLIQMGASPELAAGVRDGSISMQELSDEIVRLLERGDFTKRAFRELLGNGGFKNLLQNRMEENMLLRTDESFGKDAVTKLYSRLQEQTARLARALQGARAENSSMGKSVNQLRENVDFLNQLNQTFTYVQLPLKLSGQNAHGDLYVYTNKKNLARKDGTVSALLHLDMEHLGSIDIYVALSHEKVSTKFYLEREELMDFLEQNMHILNERLSSRGYQMSCEVLTREKPVKIIEEMMKQDGAASVLTQYSFDVRA